MITRTLTLGFLILIVLAPILTCAAKPEATAGPVRVADAAPAKVDVASVQSEYHWQTEKYEVMLRTRGQSIPWDRQGVHGLDLDTVPGVVVESLRFRPIGQEDWFHCAFSSHGDLTQITEVSAVVEGSMIKVLIRGSDAGSAYLATLVFIEGFLRTREVRSGEFPDAHYERTEYHYYNPFED